MVKIYRNLVRTDLLTSKSDVGMNQMGQVNGNWWMAFNRKEKERKLVKCDNVLAKRTPWSIFHTLNYDTKKYNYLLESTFLAFVGSKQVARKQTSPCFDVTKT